MPRSKRKRSNNPANTDVDQRANTVAKPKPARFSQLRGRVRDHNAGGNAGVSASHCGPVMPESFKAARKAAAAAVFVGASASMDESEGESEGESEDGEKGKEGEGGEEGGDVGHELERVKKKQRRTANGVSRWVQGVKITDVLDGVGKKATKGRECKIAFTLETTDGKEMDRCTIKKPHKFRLGMGKVVKGMDIGMVGMCVGGHRRLLVPAKLGYGAKKVEIIPANSDLIFDIRLLAVK